MRIRRTRSNTNFPDPKKAPKIQKGFSKRFIGLGVAAIVSTTVVANIRNFDGFIRNYIREQRVQNGESVETVYGNMNKQLAPLVASGKAACNFPNDGPFVIAIDHCLPDLGIEKQPNSSFFYEDSDGTTVLEDDDKLTILRRSSLDKSARAKLNGDYRPRTYALPEVGSVLFVEPTRQKILVTKIYPKNGIFQFQVLTPEIGQGNSNSATLDLQGRTVGFISKVGNAKPCTVQDDKRSWPLLKKFFSPDRICGSYGLVTLPTEEMLQRKHYYKY